MSARNDRWQVRGYKGACQSGPHVVQTYDGGRKPPSEAVVQMYAFLDKGKADCEYAEIVDRDKTLEIPGEAGVEPRLTFFPVRAVERGVETKK